MNAEETLRIMWNELDLTKISRVVDHMRWSKPEVALNAIVNDYGHTIRKLRIAAGIPNDGHSVMYFDKPVPVWELAKQNQ